MQRRDLLAGAGAASAVIGLSGCAAATGGAGDGPAGELTVAVTTSTYDTGLVDELHAAFEDRHGVAVNAVAGGSGQNVRRGEDGDVDVVMAHARGLEDEFLRSGAGLNRRDFAFGDFVVVGPPDDPAGVDGAAEANAAFERIAAAEAPFLSRGDDSGTHRKELAVWARADADPGGDWYREAGQGMGETLVAAGQQGAYALSVRGTYLAVRDRVSLEPVVEGPTTGGDPFLANPYGVVPVDPAVHRGVAYEAAMLYLGFLTGRRGQSIIAEFTVDGEQLFFPNALSADPQFRQYVPSDWSPGA